MNQTNKNRISIVLTLLFVLIPVMAMAQQLTPQEALNRVLQNNESLSPELTQQVERVNTKKNVIPCYTASKGNNNYYFVFEVGGDDGFIILSADKRAEPVLGYCDQGGFDINDIPCNMKWLLDTYCNDIEIAIKHNLHNVPMRANYAAVSPLISIKWGQRSPYNDQLPIYSGNERCVTGCTATAMAQVMYYHKWPTKGTGSHTYTDVIKGKEVTLSANFGNTTYQWSSMTNTYGSNSSSASKQAVALLFKHIDVAVEMNFDDGNTNQSSASYNKAAYALKTYFGYDDNIQVLYTSYWYSTYDSYWVDLYKKYYDSYWDDIICNELKHKRPVMHCGTNGQANDGGHAFVIDGHDGKGKYHINFGWDGQKDGYFALNAVKVPEWNYDFSHNYYMIIGIQKPLSSNQQYVELELTDNLDVDESQTGYDFRFSMINRGEGCSKAYIGFSVEELATGNKTYLSDNDYCFMSIPWGFEDQYFMRIIKSNPSFPTKPGKYKATLAYKRFNTNNWLSFNNPKGYRNSFEFTINSVKGDVNVDGTVNVTDVTTLVNMILGVIPKDQVHADVDGSGTLNVSDVTALIRIILGIH